MSESEQSISFNKDELEAPAFLNKEYFEKILKISENDKDLKLLNHRIEPGTKPGDHFASIMFKVYVTYNSRKTITENRLLILKTIPLEGVKKDVLADIPLFSNEIKMYTKILPEMERILRNVGDHEVMAPKIVYQSMEPPVIILDDVTKLGFEMVYQPLAFDNMKLVIEKIAKFHALSLVIADEKSEDIYFESSMMNEKSRDTLLMLVHGVKYLTQQMKTWPGFEDVHSKMDGQEAKIIDKVISAYKSNKTWGYCVLNHGDFHIKNMMFKKNQDIVNEVMLLDFQLPFWGSPAIDLAYLIYAIGNEETRDRRNEVYCEYYRNFCENLQKYGYMKKPPSLLDLHIEILKSGGEEVFLALCLMPMLFIDFSKVDIEEFFDFGGDAAKAHTAAVYKNPELLAMYKKWMPQFLHKGYLD